MICTMTRYSIGTKKYDGIRLIAFETETHLVLPSWQFQMNDERDETRNFAQQIKFRNKNLGWNERLLRWQELESNYA